MTTILVAVIFYFNYYIQKPSLQIRFILPIKPLAKLSLIHNIEKCFRIVSIFTKKALAKLSLISCQTVSYCQNQSCQSVSYCCQSVSYCCQTVSYYLFNTLIYKYLQAPLLKSIERERERMMCFQYK